jgi:hypothetical protein
MFCIELFVNESNYIENLWNGLLTTDIFNEMGCNNSL